MRLRVHFHAALVAVRQTPRPTRRTAVTTGSPPFCSPALLRADAAVAITPRKARPTLLWLDARLGWYTGCPMLQARSRRIELLQTADRGELTWTSLHRSSVTI